MRPPRGCDIIWGIPSQPVWPTYHYIYDNSEQPIQYGQFGSGIVTELKHQILGGTQLQNQALHGDGPTGLFFEGTLSVG